MRIDVYLCINGLAVSRTEAKNKIISGDVSVNGKVINKPAFEVSEKDNIEIKNNFCKYVSRGGLKLEGALKSFNISVRDRLCIDIGASTGGFTDCLLQNGAMSVIAIDTGRAQLSRKLLNDSRVISIENYNARYLKDEDLSYKPDLAVMDVSFISATYIIPSLYEVLSSYADFVCLVKPQFEVGKSNIGKGGIVKSESARQMALRKVIDFAESIGFKFVDHIVSPIKGGEGNIEFLVHFKK